RFLYGSAARSALPRWDCTLSTRLAISDINLRRTFFDLSLANNLNSRRRFLPARKVAAMAAPNALSAPPAFVLAAATAVRNVAIKFISFGYGITASCAVVSAARTFG